MYFIDQHVQWFEKLFDFDLSGQLALQGHSEGTRTRSQTDVSSVLFSGLYLWRPNALS